MKNLLLKTHNYKSINHILLRSNKHSVQQWCCSVVAADVKQNRVLVYLCVACVNTDKHLVGYFLELKKNCSAVT